MDSGRFRINALMEKISEADKTLEKELEEFERSALESISQIQTETAAKIKRIESAETWDGLEEVVGVPYRRILFGEQDEDIP
jgi:vacuolar-type H+-ATPase subunit I/STV1